MTNAAATKIKSLNIPCMRNGQQSGGNLIAKSLTITEGKLSFNGKSTLRGVGNSVIRIKVTGKFGDGKITGRFTYLDAPAPCTNRSYSAKYYGSIRRAEPNRAGNVRGALSNAVRHPIFARVYARMSPRAEAKGVAGHRRELLAGLSGRVVELGAGNGLNFPFYPSTVTEVVAVEPEDYLRDRAQEAVASAAVPVTVVDAVADELPFADGAFDAAVAALVLCSVPDQRVALAELRRVVRPGGELRFYEHVRPANPRTAAIWRRFDDWNIYPRLAGGCHAARDTEAAIRAAGFDIERCRRFPFKGGPVTAPHILGAARRP